MLVILGATGGLGNGLVELLNRHPEKGIKFGERLNVDRKQMNIEHEESVKSFCENLNSQCPPKDPLYIINAIGVSINSFCHKTSLRDFETTLRVNLTGSFLLLKYLQPLFKDRPGSSIVFLSSVVGEIGVPGTLAYAASKSAIRGLVRTASKEFARLHATVNAIELGYFEKGMIEQVPPDQLQLIIDQIPLKKLGSVENLLQACDFTLTNSFLTGSTLKLNGGMT